MCILHPGNGQILAPLCRYPALIIIPMPQPPELFSPFRPLDSQNPLACGRIISSTERIRGNAAFHAKSLQSCKCQYRGVIVFVLQLKQPGLDIAPNIFKHTARIQLCRLQGPSSAGGADHAPCFKLIFPASGSERPLDPPVLYMLLPEDLLESPWAYLSGCGPPDRSSHPEAPGPVPLRRDLFLRFSQTLMENSISCCFHLL